MKIDIFQIDAFATKPFTGNPAAVCPLERWLDDDLLLRIAAENNLSETAFFVKEGSGYRLRWFTPTTEVDLCGHATLATAFVMSRELGISANPLVFQTRSGELQVTGADSTFTLNFPAQPPKACATPPTLLSALGTSAVEVTRSEDYVVLVESEAIVRDLRPNLHALKQIPSRGFIVTAPGSKFDFVSRWFGPNVGVDEDPVTGSAHCALAPYWGARLGKRSLRAAQLSARGGELLCELEGERVLITGSAVKYMSGTIELPDVG